MTNILVFVYNSMPYFVNASSDGSVENAGLTELCF